MILLSKVTFFRKYTYLFWNSREIGEKKCSKSGKCPFLNIDYSEIALDSLRLKLLARSLSNICNK